jgi:anti-sigma B factor antagonist
MRIEKLGDVAIVSPKGWLVGGAETDELEDAIRALLAEGNRRLVLDLGEVAMLNSLAVGALVGCRQSYRTRDGLVALCGLNTRIVRMFLLTQLNMVFELHGTREQALAAVAHAA